MTCLECRETLSAEIDGEANAPELAIAAEHLVACAACRDFRDDLGSIRTRLQSWPTEASKVGFAVARRGPYPLGALPHSLRWGLTASLLIAAGAGFLAGRLWPSTVPREAPSQVPVQETLYYPATNETHTTLVLEAIDASTWRLR